MKICQFVISIILIVLIDICMSQIDVKGHIKDVITYKITEYSRKLQRKVVDQVIKSAFDNWRNVVQLEFRQLPENSEDVEDINIRFAIGDHGDGFTFDGPGGILAHSYKNFVHFDDEEHWSFAGGDLRKINLNNVAIHEIGHALGISSHSNETDAAMFPWFSDKNIKLHSDDILKIEEIYQRRRDISPRSHFNLDLCKDPEFDVMFNTPDDKTYIFKRDVYYEINGLSIVDGPSMIKNKWKGLPNDIDAVLTQNEKTFFFKNGEYWRYTGYSLDDGYPERVDKFYNKIPNTVDSAIVLRDNQTYFFRGSKFYRLNNGFNEEYAVVEEGQISDEFQGIPTHIDAAFYTPYHHRLYFFKDGSFHVYDFSSVYHPPYAIPVNSYFFDC